MFLVIFLWAVLAATFILAKQTLAYSNPAFLVGIRFILAGSVLLGYQWIVNKKSIAVKREDWWKFLLISLYHVYLAFMLEFWCLQYVSALKTTIIYSSTPFVVAILAYFVINERLSKMKKIGIAIGFFGLIPTLLVQASGAELAMELFRISIPEVLLMISVVSAAYAWFLIVPLMKKGYGVGVINGYAFFMGGLLSMATAVLFYDMSHPVKAIVPFFAWLALLIVASNIIFYNLYTWLLKRYSITFLSFTGFLCPCFGTLFDWLFLGGIISWHYFASLCLITIGLYIFHREEFGNVKT
ncbi:MAG: DMT family transporter [bacterium]